MVEPSITVPDLEGPLPIAPDGRARPSGGFEAPQATPADFQAAEPVRPTGGGESAPWWREALGEQWGAVFGEMRAEQDRLSAQWARCKDLAHPERERRMYELVQEGRGIQVRMLELQTAVQREAFNVQLASKVVEHAVSSTKTVMQTQA